jgi:hypothetical protein
MSAPAGSPSSSVSSVSRVRTVSVPTSGLLTPAGGPVAGTAPTTGPVPETSRDAGPVPGTTRDERMRERLMPGPPPRDVAPPSEPAAAAKEGAPLGLLLLFAAAIYFLAK